MILVVLVDEGKEVPNPVNTASNNDVVTDVRRINRFEPVTMRENVLQLPTETVAVKHLRPRFRVQGGHLCLWWLE